MAKSSDIRLPRESSLSSLLAVAAVGSTVAAASWALSQMGSPLLNALGQAIPARSLALLILLLLLALVLTYCWALSLLRRLREPRSRDFDFDQFGGYYIDRKTKVEVCAHCLSLDPPRVVHLMDVGGSKLCNACDKAYRGKPET